MFDVQKIPLVLLIAYFGTVLFRQPTWTDVGVLSVLGGISAFYEAWTQLKRYKQQDEEIQKLTARVEKFEKAEQELRTHVAGLKLGTQLMMGKNGR